MLIRDQSPSHVAVAFDIPVVPTFRHKLFPAYQGHAGRWAALTRRISNGRYRRPCGCSSTSICILFQQRALRPTTCSVLTTIPRACDVESLVVTTDRDLQQLVGPGVRVLIPGKKPLEIGPEQVVERLGVRPDQIVHWKVLAGDASDNIPGVTGIGDKSAVDLLRQYGTVEGIYEHLDDLPGRQRKALEAGRADAELFEKVVAFVPIWT